MNNFCYVQIWTVQVFFDLLITTTPCHKNVVKGYYKRQSVNIRKLIRCWEFQTHWYVVRNFSDISDFSWCNYFFIPGTHILHLSFTTQHTLIYQLSGICVWSLNFSLDIFFWTSDGYIRAPPYSNFSRVRNLTPKFSIIFDDNEQNHHLVLLVFSSKTSD